jgi:siroheme synthase
VTVYFIGAGPGAADLITVRGQRLLQRHLALLHALYDFFELGEAAAQVARRLKLSTLVNWVMYMP